MSDRLSNQLQWCKDREKGVPLPNIVWPDPIDSEPFKSNRAAVGYVYMIKAGDFIKVGIARDIARRIAAMQTGCPFELEIVHVWPSAHPLRLEKRLHFKLREFRYRGEWFKIPDSVLSELI